MNTLAALPQWVDDIPLAGWWWVLGFAVLTGLGVLVSSRVHPRRWLFLTVPLTVLGLGMTAVAWANTYYFTLIPDVGQVVGAVEYPTAGEESLSSPRGEYPEGAVVTTRIPSPRSRVGARQAMVYLPPQWFTEPERRFPVIYLQHGVLDLEVPGLSSDAGPRSFFKIIPTYEYALAAARQGHPVVLVVPVNGRVQGDSECVNSPQGDWYTYLANDVPAWVAANPRLLTGASHTAIGGYSMGGYCAQMLALRNPDEFSISGNMSGSEGPVGQYGADELFGTRDDTNLAEQYSSRYLIATDPGSRSVTLFMEVGSEDDRNLLLEQEAVTRTARDNGMKVVSRVVPGEGHTFDLWRDSFERWIPWAAARLYNDREAPQPR